MKLHHGKILKKKYGYKIIDCELCKFIHIDPIPSAQKLKNLYRINYYKNIKPDFIKKHETEIEYWNAIYDEKLDTMKRYVKSKTKKILDIGCGPGFFLKRSKHYKWDVFGIEPSQIAAEYAEKHGIPVVKDFFQNLDLQKLGKFNAIYMHDVLEHSSDPSEILKNCNTLLKNNGIIVIETPNDFNPLQKVVQKALKKTEYWLAPPQHINYFNFTSLTNLLEKNGFQILLKESTFPLELFLLMGINYIGNDKVGKKIHKNRIKMEMNFKNGDGVDLKRQIYQYFAKIGIGRTSIIYAKKIKNSN